MISDALVARKHAVMHLGLGKNVKHQMWDVARRVQGGHLVYDK
jgi:hypothetical protein